MVWQDIVVSIANLLFSYSLIVQVIRGFRKRRGFLSLQSSFLTTIGLYAMSLTFFTLNLFLSSIISAFNGTMWLLLFIQGIVYPRD